MPYTKEKKNEYMKAYYHLHPDRVPDGERKKRNLNKIRKEEKDLKEAHLRTMFDCENTEGCFV